MPELSVILPVYNCAPYIGEAIDSILAQTYSDYEIIIIDDGSCDGSADIISRYKDSRIRFFQNERNMGISATLNRGLDLALGKYIARMDGDDISLPDRFAIQTEYMNTHPEIAICGTDVMAFGDENQIWRYPHTPEAAKATLLKGSVIVHPTAMMRKELFGSNLLKYDSSYDGLEDYELLYRTARSHRIVSLPQITLKYRIHKSQVSRYQHTDPEFIRKYTAFKARQMADIGLPTSGEEFNAYIHRCLNQNCDITALTRYCELIWKSKAARDTYDRAALRGVIDEMERQRINKLPFAKSVRVMRKGGGRWVRYLLWRGIGAVKHNARKMRISKSNG